MTASASNLSIDAAAFQSLICLRTTVLDFSSEALPEGALHRALQVGLTAPNHRMTEPWRFFRVGKETRERLAAVQARLKDRGRTPSEETFQRARAKLLTPPEFLVLVRAVHPDANVGREDYAAIACAVQNISLSLWAEGVGSKWGTGGATTDPETYAILGLDAAKSEIVGFFYVGFPKGESPRKPPRRLGVEQVLTELP